MHGGVGGGRLREKRASEDVVVEADQEGHLRQKLVTGVAGGGRLREKRASGEVVGG
jgi:hypothetical protein